MIDSSPPPPAGAPPAQDLFAGPGGRVLAAAHEAIVIVDRTQRIVALNPAAEAMFGCPAGKALGQSVDRFVPERARAGHGAKVRAFADSKATQHRMAAGRRVEVLRCDGSEFPAEIALSRVEMVGRDGKPHTYFAALLRDLSDERALEREVQALQRRMRAVFELSPIAIWICEDDHLVFANRAAARLFDRDSVDGLIGRSVFALLDADSHTALRGEIARALAGDGAGAILAARMTRADGTPRELEIALAALPDHGRTTVQMVVNDVTERRREAADLDRSRRALRELSASVVEAREEERRRIARELHDELGQRLTALKIDLVGLAADDERVVAMQATLDDTVAAVRRIASDLRPLMLDDLGLSAAIEWLARDASRRMGIAVHARLPLADPALDQRTAIALYRMVQEALTNVARHAQARTVEIELRAHDSELVLAVADDGVGLGDEALQRAGSFGLMGMRERVQMLGGQMDIRRRARGGTRLTVRLPLTASECRPA